MALGSTQALTEMSTRNLTGGKRRRRRRRRRKEIIKIKTEAYPLESSPRLHKLAVSPPSVNRLSRTVIFNLGYSKTSCGYVKLEEKILFRDKH
jgi:hypothetical protein